MNSKIKDMVMSLFLTKSARSIVVVGVCGLVFMFSEAFSMADDYRWIESPPPEGDQQLMPVDPKICKCYEKNLRYFARRNTPMSCERPVAPCLKNRIKKVEWEDLDPDQYPDLFRAIALCRVSYLILRKLSSRETSKAFVPGLQIKFGSFDGLSCHSWVVFSLKHTAPILNHIGLCSMAAMIFPRIIRSRLGDASQPEEAAVA